MHRLLAAVVGSLVVVTVGCADPRQPVTRGQASAIAGNLQLREGWAWGEPTEILPPVESHGHRWWQLRYAGDHVILVDVDSGWARLPPSDYVLRRAATAPVTPTVEPVLVSEGHFLLVLAPSSARDAEGEGALDREAARLNALAAQTGLYPLFSVRSDRQGRSSLVYGWQGDRGIAQDARVTEWLKVRTTHREARWVDLLAE